MAAKKKRSFRGRQARFEALEERCLLASSNTDIRLNEVVAQGGASVTVGYEIADAPASPFSLGFYRSSDTTFDPSDELLGRVAIDDTAKLTQGIHSETFPIGGANPIRLPGAGAAETDNDYYILAVADADDTVAESDADPFREDNTGVLQGVYNLPGGDVFVHGTDDPETINVLPGSLRLEIDGDILTYDGDDVTGLRARGHGGDDTLNFTYGAGFGLAGPFSGFIDGGPGSNTATLTGSTGDDVVNVYPQSVSMSGPGYTLEVRGLSQASVSGGGGSADTASFFDSTGDNYLEARYTDDNTTWAAMWAAGRNQNLLYEATGFPLVRAYRSTGLDTAEYAADITFLDAVGDWISPSWSADGTTDANGRVALTVGGRSVNFELVDEATGDPLAAMPVALVLDARSASFGYLAYGDPGGAYPLQMALVTGGTVDTAVAASNDARATPAGVQARVQASLDLAVEDSTKVRVKKNVDTINENLLVKGIEKFSKPTGKGISLVKDANGYAGLAVKALTLALGEPNSPVVGEQVFATPEAALFQVNKDLNEKNVDSLFVHAGMMALGAAPAVGGVLLGFGVDAVDAQRRPRVLRGGGIRANGSRKFGGEPDRPADFLDARSRSFARS